MPTLELLKLQLKPGVAATSPALLKVLSEVRAFVRTNSHFYTTLEDSSLLYILGEWPSLSAHKEFLSSPDREKVLKPQEELADFVWCHHLPTELSMQDCVPFPAPVLALARLWIKASSSAISSFTHLVDKYRNEIIMGSASEVLCDGWVEEDETEFVMISGWESRERHAMWRETMRRDVPEYAGVRRYYDTSKGGGTGMEVVHLVDIERTAREKEGSGEV